MKESFWKNMKDIFVWGGGGWTAGATELFVKILPLSRTTLKSNKNELLFNKLA